MLSVLVLLVVPLLLSVATVYLTDGHYYEWQPSVPSKENGQVVTNEYYTRSDVYIPIHNSEEDNSLHGWFYLPLDDTNQHAPYPIVLMMHGLGGQKDMGLEKYAVEFVKHDVAVLAIDYRSFGGSISKVRNLVDPTSHIEDINTAITAIRSKILLGSKVDSSRIVLWGTSMAGGHALVVSSQLAGSGAIKGVIAQVPHLNGKVASFNGIKKRGLLGTVRVAIIAALDFVRSALFHRPHIYVKIAGRYNETSYMPLSEDELVTYFSKHPDVYLGGWANLASAKQLLFMSQYNPINHVTAIDVPVLMIGASDDTLCPIDLIRSAFSLLPTLPSANKHRFIEVNGSHFDVYGGKVFDQIIRDMTLFLTDVVK